MRLATLLVVFGAAIGVAMMLDSRRRPRVRRGDERGGASFEPPAGISQIDPQPLTQISAEAVDPDATRAAHEAIADQRDRLAVHGKNVL